MKPEDEAALLRRITTRSDVYGGKPIIRDMRLAVEHVLENLAAGDTHADLLQDYPFLEDEDIRACLLYASRLSGQARQAGVAVPEVHAPVSG